jgi:hypothetical protein
MAMKATAMGAALVAILVAAMPMAASAAGKADTAKGANVWVGVAKLPNLWEGTWQGDTDLYSFPGPIEYTPSAAEYVKTYKPAEDSTFANCKEPGMPMTMRLAAMPLKFYYSPNEKMISIYIEGSSRVRFIHMDGRKHSAQPDPTFLGESIGHWEGATLVIDSIGFVKDTTLQIGQMPSPTGGPGGPGAPDAPNTAPIFAPHGPNLHIIERMKPLDRNTMQVSVTLDDPSIFAKPYTYSDKFYRHTGPRSEPQEWVCSDNRDVLDTTTGKLQYNQKDKAISQ